MTHKVTGNGGSNPGNAQVVGTPPSITSNDITKVAGKEWLQSVNPSVVENRKNISTNQNKVNLFQFLTFLYFPWPF